MFCGRHNRKFREQNFTYKSEHDKRVLQRNSREDLQYSLKEQEKELGEFELDESYFGARRVRGKRGRGAAGKTPVFGLLKRKGKVFVTVVRIALEKS